MSYIVRKGQGQAARALTPQRRHMKIEDEKGMTLIELMVVVSIAAILVIALGFEFRDWMGRYKMESEIKQMYVDIMNTRARAMQRNRFHSIVLTANTYTAYEDMNENEAVDVAEILPAYPKALNSCNMVWTGGGNTITFNTRGLVVPPTRTIRVLAGVVDSDYDCMTVLDTKTNMGKWNGAVCQIK